MSTPAATDLVKGIQRAIRARDFAAVAAFMKELAVIDPRMAQDVLDTIDFAIGVQEKDIASVTAGAERLARDIRQAQIPRVADQ